MTTPMPVTGSVITLAQANELAGRFGKTVTSGNLALAELTLSLRSGVDISSADAITAMDATDKYWLAQAILFQALWLPGQPDVLSRIDAAQIETDGDAMTLNHDAIMLAPLAKWALLRTSLMSWGTVTAQPDERVLGTGYSKAITDIGFRRWIT